MALWVEVCADGTDGAAGVGGDVAEVEGAAVVGTLAVGTTVVLLAIAEVLPKKCEHH